MINGDERYESLLEILLDEIGRYPNTLLKNEREIKNFISNHRKKTENALYSVQDALDDLRLSVKYLLFDLDATRRENLYLKKLIEDKES